MSGGLVIRLRPYEKFLVNGVVIENSDKRARLRIKSQGANILRLRDALHPEEATTPVKRLYYLAQLVVTGDVESGSAVAELSGGLKSLHTAMPDPKCREAIENAQRNLNDMEFYQIMRALRPLIPLEEKLLLIARAKNLGCISESPPSCSSSQQ